MVAALLAMPGRPCVLLLFHLALVAFPLELFPLGLFSEDVHELIHQIWMLIIYAPSDRQVCPLHCLAYREQADRCAGLAANVLALHKQINLLYEFFCSASRLSVSTKSPSSRLISSRMASAVMSAIIQLLAF